MSNESITATPSTNISYKIMNEMDSLSVGNDSASSVVLTINNALLIKNKAVLHIKNGAKLIIDSPAKLLIEEQGVFICQGELVNNGIIKKPTGTEVTEVVAAASLASSYIINSVVRCCYLQQNSLNEERYDINSSGVITVDDILAIINLMGEGTNAFYELLENNQHYYYHRNPSSIVDVDGLFRIQVNLNQELGEITYDSGAVDINGFQIYGFQIYINGFTDFQSSSGGAAGTAGFIITTASNSNQICITGFSLAGNSIAAGSGILLDVAGAGSPQIEFAIFTTSQDGNEYLLGHISS